MTVLLKTSVHFNPNMYMIFMPPCVVLPVFASLIMNQMRDVVLTFLFLLYTVFQTFLCMWCIGAKKKKILNCKYLCAGAPLYSSLYSHVYSYIPEDNVHSDAILTTSTWLTAVATFWAMYRDAFEALDLFYSDAYRVSDNRHSELKSNTISDLLLSKFPPGSCYFVCSCAWTFYKHAHTYLFYLHHCVVMLFFFFQKK